MTCRLQRVCVIGAGLAGLACALAASRRGLQVQVLDERGMPADLDAHVEVVPNMLRDLVDWVWRTTACAPALLTAVWM
jgi:flavin-dependent dehydrogenase